MEMFTKGFGKYACEGDTITCDVEGFTATATLYRDDNQDAPDENQDGFWPSREPGAAGWVRPEDFDAQQDQAERIMQAWKDDKWYYCGVAVTIAKNDIELTGKFANALWCVECNYPDSDNSYLMEVANELLSEALDNARATLQKLCA